jgi:NAD(P)-dependent dehydrogenase (short-subunit alcohol dehydrogenase family)
MDDSAHGAQGTDETHMSLLKEAVWFVTGASRGFGREIVTVALERGYRVAGGVRNAVSVEDIRTAHPDNFLALEFDVTDRPGVERAVSRAAERFGRLDVLVNNAGRGYLAAIEEGEPDEIRSLFEVNVFSYIWLTQAVLPIMRRQGSGCIVNMSSVGGLNANPGHGYYAATKFAIEGISDALAGELEPLGIRVIVVEPGAFRTEFFERDRIDKAKATISDYAATAEVRKEAMIGMSGKQPGDPRRGAELIVKAVEADKAPLRLPLGAAGIARIRWKLGKIAADIDHWEAEASDTDYPEGSTA